MVICKQRSLEAWAIFQEGAAAALSAVCRHRHPLQRLGPGHPPQWRLSCSLLQNKIRD